VTVSQKGKIQTGTAIGLNPQGKLILQTPDGKQHLLDSGELLATGATGKTTSD
jgi:biotin-(acetyl-CoA carboxylase) ligase